MLGSICCESGRRRREKKEKRREEGEGVRKPEGERGQRERVSERKRGKSYSPGSLAKRFIAVVTSCKFFPYSSTSCSVSSRDLAATCLSLDEEETKNEQWMRCCCTRNVDTCE